MFRGHRGPQVTNSFWHRCQIRWNGRKDGQEGRPAENEQAPSAYEQRLLNRGTQHLQQTVDDFADRIQQTEAQRNDAIDQLEHATGRCIHEVDRYNARKRALGRDVIIHLPRSWYLAFVGIIVLGEFALNSQAFDIFQKAPWLTYLMALTVAVGLPFVAHFIGIWIRQWPAPAWKTGTKVAVSIVVTLGCLVGLNVARQQYLHAVGVDLGTADTVLERAFFLINVFVFLTAVLMSYFSHDEDQDLENLHFLVQRMDAEVARLTNGARRLGGTLDGLLQREHAELQHIGAVIRELVFLYRHANERARTTPRPIYFSQPPVLADVQRAPEAQGRADEARIDTCHAKRLAAWAAVAPEEIQVKEVPHAHAVS